jgi:plasmid stabilization system protein ParE
MAEKKRWAIAYSTHSLKQAREIVAYLRRRFSQKEIDQFYDSLESFENIIALYPTLYPETSRLKIRRAVLSKVLSVYYTLGRNKVYVVAIMDNRWDEEKKIKS